MARDPFNTDQFLNRDFHSRGEDAEAWQGALRNEEDAEQVATERSGPSARVRFFGILIAGVLLILLSRLMYLQLANFEQNRALAEGNRIRESDIRAPRGVIYDANRQIIARNIPNFEVLVTPNQLPRKTDDRQAVYQQLGDIIKKPPADIQKAAEAKGSRYSQPVLIADKLDRDTSVMLAMRQSELSGVTVDDNPQRQYAQAELYAHLLGYTGRVSEEDLKRNPDFQASDYVGKSGLEAVYERDLRGQAGKRRLEVNAQGQSLKELQSSDPVSGQNLVLSVDPRLQEASSKSLDNAIKSAKGKPTGGSAIALNPKTGEVLALVSLPSFDNNKFVNGISESDYRELADDAKKPLFNRPVSGEYPPGSTFKIVTATAALNEGTLSPDTYLSSPPFLDIQGYKFPDWDPKGHGSVNAAGALAVSSDVYFYKAAGGGADAKGIGEEKLGDYMRQFAIGQRSGIDLPDEKTGLVPTDQWKRDTVGEPWYIGDTYHMGIGQGFVLTTPIQVANYTAAVANGGVAYKPHLVKSLEDPDNTANNKNVQPQPLINLKAGNEVMSTVKAGMRQAVVSGTARDLATFPEEVCGKTGSAEFANETKSHAWFTAFAPCDNPQIVVTVMVEGGGEGSDTALPAARRILEAYFNVAPPAKT